MPLPPRPVTPKRVEGIERSLAYQFQWTARLERELRWVAAVVVIIALTVVCLLCVGLFVMIWGGWNNRW